MSHTAPTKNFFRADRPSRRPTETTLRPRARTSRVVRRRKQSGFIPRMLSLIDRVLPPSYAPGINPELNRRGRLFVAASFAFVLISLFFGSQMIAVDQYPLINVVIMYSGSIFAIANLLLLRYTKSPAIPGALLCLEALAIQYFQAYNDLGLDDPVLLWTLVIPWLAALLVGPTYGFVFAGIVISVTGAFYFMEMQGGIFHDYTGHDEYLLFYLLIASTMALFFGFLGWLYEGQTLKNLRETNQKIASAHADLQKSNQRTERILESITDGFFTLDATWAFTDLNRQAEHFLRMRRSEMLGTKVWEYFQGQVGQEIQDHFRKAAQLGVPAEFETYYPPLGRWFKVHVYPHEDGLSVYFNDITKRKEYEKQLIEAKEEAEQLAHLKSTLLANMSHEIRTPLTSVLGFSSILAEEATGAHKEFAQLIGQNGKRLMDTLNSVLDLAQLESGAMKSKPGIVNLEEEVEQMVLLLTPLADEKGLFLRTECTLQDATGAIDRAMLNRVLNNLVGNAIKFTPEGGVVVTISGTEDQLLVSVTDTGIGISDDFLPQLFEEFRQESTGLARSYEGNGLGLSITRRLVELMHGAIDVKSKKGVGTTFTVKIPRNVSAPFNDVRVAS